MPRKLRIQFPGARYHVMNRGNGRGRIFHRDEDRELFLQALGEVCTKTGWQVHAYCLMANHFHLAIETPEPNLVAGMKWLLGTYTIRFNARHRSRGHLFGGRYKALLVDPEDSSYLRTVCQYIHLNPARAQILKEEERLEAYPWSSYRWFLSEPARRPAWLRTDRLFGELRLRDRKGDRKRLSESMEAWRREEKSSGYAPIRRGWFLGDRGRREDLLRRYHGSKSKNQYGEQWKEAAEPRAEEWIVETMRKGGWDEARLGKERKSHPFKLALAVKLREETPLTVRWIAERLQMGSEGSLRLLLYRHRKTEERG